MHRSPCSSADSTLPGWFPGSSDTWTWTLQPAQSKRPATDRPPRADSAVAFQNYTHARSLNGLDLSGMDLRRTKLQSARINRVILKGANLEGVVLDQAWSLNSDFTGASLKGASLFATQFGGSKLDGADFTKARVAGDFTNASIRMRSSTALIRQRMRRTNRWALCAVPSRAQSSMAPRSRGPTWHVL